MFSRVLITWFVLSLVMWVGGCRRAHTFSLVEGTITKAGQPLADVLVIFFPDPELQAEGQRSVGTTDSTGHYRLRMDSGDDGVVVGQYRVCILGNSALSVDERRRLTAQLLNKEKDVSTKPQESSVRKEDQGLKEPKVPAIYRHIHETPLRAEVRPGDMQTFDFNIP